MKHSSLKLIVSLWVAMTSGGWAQTNETHAFNNLNRAVPDGNASGLSVTTNLTTSLGYLTGVKVKLNVAGEYNGDLYVYVRHLNAAGTNLCVLLNRPGRSAGSGSGYADAGFNVTFDSAATNGDIHLYQLVQTPSAGTPLTGTWQPDGRLANPFSVTETNQRNTSLTNFLGMDASGEWTVFVADLESGGTNLLASWELELTGLNRPTLVWTNPADIVYGTSLGNAQLNATSSVPGTYDYTPPLGTILNAGSNQVLSVTFRPADTNNFLPSSTSVMIQVQKHNLTITANDTNKVYGASLPGLTATYNGFVNGDSTNTLFALATLTTTATNDSPVGHYPITVSGASSSNYAFTFSPGTLAILKAPTDAQLLTSVNPSQLGQSVTFTAQVGAVAPGAGLPSGAVQFKTNSVAAGDPVTLVAGQAVFVTALLVGGTNSVSVEYVGDGNFIGSTNMLLPAQVVNRPPVASTDYLTRSLTNGVKVLISNLLTNDTDPDGDAISFVSVSPTSTNGGVVTTNQGWVYYSPASLFATNQDAFTYTISDGRGGLGVGWVVVHPPADSAFAPNLSIAMLGTNTFLIRFSGIAGLTYRIQTATNLVSPDWLTIGSVMANEMGLFQFTNEVGAETTNNFFRSAFP
jgi:subtilisin-like proprotein convertase family protein